MMLAKQDVQEVTRDLKTILTALDNVTQKLRKMPCNPRDDRLNYEFNETMSLWLKSIRAKPMRNRLLFVPKGEYRNFDGMVRCNDKTTLRTYTIPYIDTKNVCRIGSCVCTSLMTDRGLCWFCIVRDSCRKNREADGFISGDVIFIIKDHAIRRAIERSPIKDYNMALGLILWAAFKADRIELEPIDVLNNYDSDRIKTAKATRVIYSSFGKVVGTSFDMGGRDADMVLVNTYLSDEMYVRGEYND